MKRVFISFRHEDKPQVNGLRLLAGNDKFGIELYDESLAKAVDSEDAKYIKTKINEKIALTSVTVCVLNALTHTSKWVDWELKTSFAKGNKLIFMGLKDGPPQPTVPDLSGGFLFQRDDKATTALHTAGQQDRSFLVGRLR